MNLFRVMLPLLLLAGSFSASARANWAKIGLDPAKAYVLVQVEPLEFNMLGNNRVVTGLMLAQYDLEKSAIRLSEKDGKVVNAMRLTLIGESIASDGKRKQYFAEIAPGTWVIEGAGGGSGGTLGAAVTAFSLGSYRFDARGGEVIDLGVVTPSREESSNPDTQMTTGKLAGMMMMGGLFGGSGPEPLPLKLAIRPRGNGDLAMPAWLSGATVTQPALTYGSTFQNLLGGLINRVDGKVGRRRAAGEVLYLSKPGQSDQASLATP
jgi:hypothetical protein